MAYSKFFKTYCITLAHVNLPIRLSNVLTSFAFFHRGFLVQFLWTIFGTQLGNHLLLMDVNGNIWEQMINNLLTNYMLD